MITKKRSHAKISIERRPLCATKCEDLLLKVTVQRTRTFHFFDIKYTLVNFRPNCASITIILTRYLPASYFCDKRLPCANWASMCAPQDYILECDAMRCVIGGFFAHFDRVKLSAGAETNTRAPLPYSCQRRLSRVNIHVDRKECINFCEKSTALAINSVNANDF